MRNISLMGWFILLLLPACVQAQISLSSNTVNFFTVYTDEADTLSLTIQNNTAVPYVVDDVDWYHKDAFRVETTTFTVPANGSYTFDVICEPLQNVRTADQLIISSSSHPDQLNTFLYAFVRHRNPYYDLTFDKYHEDLKAAISTLTAFGYTDLGYNPARDKLFMEIENEMANGQGAAVNTITCRYTGTVAAGYTTRIDAQDNYNLNTEHVFPQGLFGSLQPMRSDMHHLFVVTANSNSERGSKPFGNVTNPSWTQGGSSASGSTFEPRDATKGDVARAMMYFVLRYQDYNNFFAGQEAILRNWHQNFPPDAQDIIRNDQIEVYQKNRNPFVDHPEFTDRIASISQTNHGPMDPILFQVQDQLNFGSVAVGDTVIGTWYISNQGINDLVLSNPAFSDPNFSLRVTPNFTIPKDSARKVRIAYHPATMSVHTGTLSFATNDPTASTVDVTLNGDGNGIMAIDATHPLSFSVTPNPASDMVRLAFSEPQLESARMQLSDITGRVVRRTHLATGEQFHTINVRSLPPGLYFVRVEAATGSFTQKILVR